MPGVLISWIADDVTAVLVFLDRFHPHFCL